MRTSFYYFPAGSLIGLTCFQFKPYLPLFKCSNRPINSECKFCFISSYTYNPSIGETKVAIADYLERLAACLLYRPSGCGTENHYLR